MYDIVINYFTANNGLFRPLFRPLPRNLDFNKTIFIESDPRVFTKIYSLINFKSRIFGNLKPIIHLNDLSNPTAVYRLMDLNPSNLYIFQYSTKFLFEKISLLSDKIPEKEIVSSIDIADNLHRLMCILTDTIFYLYYPSNKIFDYLIENNADETRLGLPFAEKSHLLKNKKDTNLIIKSYLPSINSLKCNIDFKQFAEATEINSENLLYLNLDFIIKNKKIL